MLFERWGKKLAAGAKAEILNPDRLIEIGEVIFGIGLLVLGLVSGSKKPQEPATIIINNYISQNSEQKGE